MITGFNTDIDHDGRVYHVQTEDKGVANPIVESLIYCSGEIIGKRQTGYDELADSDGFSEEAVLALMESQHKRMIREVVNGRYDTEGPKPFGHQFITARSLDQVVLDFLVEHCAPRPIRIELLDQQVLHEGTRPTLRLRLVDRITDEPAVDTVVRIQLISTVDDPRELFTGSTDDGGYVEACFELPDLSGADGAIMVDADGADRDASVRQLVAKAKRGVRA